MKYVYGPIPSRRLGQSLGIDPIPFKTCNWNCVYCQLGRTAPMTNTRREYAPPDAILAEAAAALAAHPPGTIDWVSFVGSGEPTLHSAIGHMIRRVKALTGIPVAVITNGALLYLPEVREDLRAADAVMPTLAAGEERLFRRITRPWPELTFERLLGGLIDFRQAYTGRLWVEVMLIRGMNDTDDALRALATALKRVGPDAIHLTLPDRPPAEPWVRPPDQEGLLRATAILGALAEIVPPSGGDVDLSGCQDAADAALAVIRRHPIREVDLRRALGRWAPDQVAEALQRLAAGGQARLVMRYGQRFWSYAGARYAD